MFELPDDEWPSKIQQTSAKQSISAHTPHIQRPTEYLHQVRLLGQYGFSK